MYIKDECYKARVYLWHGCSYSYGMQNALEGERVKKTAIKWGHVCIG